MKELGLNLLPSQARFNRQLMEIRRKVRIIIVSVLIVWVIVGAGIWSGWWWVEDRVAAEEKKLKRANNEYQSMSSTVVTTLQLKYRAKLVGKVLQDRFEYADAFTKVHTLFNNNNAVVLTDYELKSRDQFGIKCKTTGDSNVDYLEKRVDEINSGKVGGFKSAKVYSLVFKNNEWEIQMEVNLSGKNSN